MAVYAETLELRCACRDVHNRAGASTFLSGRLDKPADPAWNTDSPYMPFYGNADQYEQWFRHHHTGEQCSVTVTRRSPQRQGRLL